jgi:hypothetical protein
MGIESIIDLMTLWKESLFWECSSDITECLFLRKELWKLNCDLCFLKWGVKQLTVWSIPKNAEVKREMLGRHSVFWVSCFLFPTKLCKKRSHSCTFQPTICLLLPTFLTPLLSNNGVLINQGHWQSSYLSNPIGKLFSSYLFCILILFVLLPSKLTPWLSHCLL